MCIGAYFSVTHATVSLTKDYPSATFDGNIVLLPLHPVTVPLNILEGREGVVTVPLSL